MATILIVDDHPQIRFFLAQLLGSGGHRLLEASDGAEALQHARAERPDLIISDLFMPTMDGFELVRQIRSDPAIAATPVIYFTATYHRSQIRELAEACGVRHILTKPSRGDEILRTVHAVLGMHHDSIAPPAPEVFHQEHLRVVTDKLSQKMDALGVQLAALVELNLELSTEQDPRRMLEQFCRAAREILGAQFAVARITGSNVHNLPEIFTAGLDADTAGHLVASLQSQQMFAALLTERRPCRLRGEVLSGLSLRSLLGAPIVSPTRDYGWLCLLNKLGAEEFSEQDERLAGILAAQVGRIYESSCLYAEVQQHAVQLKLEIAERQQAEHTLRQYSERLQSLSRQLLTAQETERRRLARELHDEIGQVLSAVKLNLQTMQRITHEPALAGRWQESLDLISRTLQQVRDLSLDLRPSMLDDFGLVAALRWYLERQAQRTGLDIQLSADGEAPRLPAAIETACFRVAQEALTNVIRHAHARCVHVELRRVPTAIELIIRDDGTGFDVSAAHHRAARGASLGLLGMQERVSLIGGQMEITSTATGGTEIRSQFSMSLFPKVAEKAGVP